MFSSNIIKLNVGGTIFQTSKSTLIKFDGMFRTMLGTGVPLEKDETGCIFIDRDPTHFQLILNFMRDGGVDLTKYLNSIDEIKKEAEFYLLDGLKSLCEENKLRSSSGLFSKEENGIYVLDKDTDLIKLLPMLKKTVLVYRYHFVKGKEVHFYCKEAKLVIETFREKYDIVFVFIGIIPSKQEIHFYGWVRECYQNCTPLPMTRREDQFGSTRNYFEAETHYITVLERNGKLKLDASCCLC